MRKAFHRDCWQLQLNLSSFDRSVWKLCLDQLCHVEWIILVWYLLVEKTFPVGKLELLFEAIVIVDVQIEASQNVLVSMLFDIHFHAHCRRDCDDLLDFKLVVIYAI